MSCRGSCNQGRKPCPTPDMCLAKRDPIGRYALPFVVVLIGLVALLLGVEFWR